MNLSSCCDVFNMPHYYNREINDLMIGIGSSNLSYSMYSTYSCHIAISLTIIQIFKIVIE